MFQPAEGGCINPGLTRSKSRQHKSGRRGGRAGVIAGGHHPPKNKSMGRPDWDGPCFFRLPVNRAGQFFVLGKFSARRHGMASVDSYSLFPRVFPVDRFRPVKSPEMPTFSGLSQSSGFIVGNRNTSSDMRSLRRRSEMTLHSRRNRALLHRGGYSTRRPRSLP